MSIPPPPGSTDLSLLLGGVLGPAAPLVPPEQHFAATPEEVNPPPLTGEHASASRKQKEDAHKHLRKAAGKVWNDPSLEQWPDNDFRVFCGDLGNEVTDELLANAFRQYRSFNRAKVVRDSRTGKTKGYGFVSFNRPEDMLAAVKEMNRKYVGNRPIRVLKSKWKERDINSSKNKADAGSYKLVPTNAKVIKKFQGNKNSQAAAKPNGGAGISTESSRPKPSSQSGVGSVYWSSKFEGR
eukprot:Gregarina_sp_Pseudo_9__4721@NODE_491_length_2716_cov_22_728054_g463_i0_p2_GENE_NODE_491_length_2716_cov_22_728054_g463_i0NODE_491_length_2716_cov_22_728054_g463_i0_p2_ORF_typecomplete_len239_score43_62RRM_1/PF00076_22/1_3e03RRM_1/PF00076_22/5_5e19RRM_7/PF16367_5/0_0014DUF2075/PF09848_9/0_0025RRM_2/PF04059_12/0_053RRM_5/PF13893_6/0_055Limkainb1/PF11608_8/0_19GARP/PF16731_5/1_6GARP/PF16731_5/6_3e03_NODE_491_length_2716_cov_22_728054_g463_i03461062